MEPVYLSLSASLFYGTQSQGTVLKENLEDNSWWPIYGLWLWPHYFTPSGGDSFTILNRRPWMVKEENSLKLLSLDIIQLGRAVRGIGRIFRFESSFRPIVAARPTRKRRPLEEKRFMKWNRGKLIWLRKETENETGEEEGDKWSAWETVCSQLTTWKW